MTLLILGLLALAFLIALVIDHWLVRRHLRQMREAVDRRSEQFPEFR